MGSYEREYEEGRLAYRTSVPFHMNPYGKDPTLPKIADEQWKDWNRGWNAAKSEAST